MLGFSEFSGVQALGPLGLPGFWDFGFRVLGFFGGNLRFDLRHYMGSSLN